MALHHEKVTARMVELEQSGRIAFLNVWETPNGAKRWTVAITEEQSPAYVFTLSQAEAFLRGVDVPSVESAREHRLSLAADYAAQDAARARLAHR